MSLFLTTHRSSSTIIIIIIIIIIIVITRRHSQHCQRRQRLTSGGSAYVGARAVQVVSIVGRIGALCRPRPLNVGAAINGCASAGDRQRCHRYGQQPRWRRRQRQRLGEATSNASGNASGVANGHVKRTSPTCCEGQGGPGARPPANREGTGLPRRPRAGPVGSPTSSTPSMFEKTPTPTPLSTPPTPDARTKAALTRLPGRPSSIDPGNESSRYPLGDASARGSEVGPRWRATIPKTPVLF